MQWTRTYQPDSQNNKLYTRALIITLTGNVLLAAILLSSPENPPNTHVGIEERDSMGAKLLLLAG